MLSFLTQKFPDNDQVVIENVPDVSRSAHQTSLDKQALDSIVSAPARIQHASLYGVNALEKKLVLQSLKTDASVTVAASGKTYSSNVQQSSQLRSFMPLAPPTLLCPQATSEGSAKTLIYLTDLPDEDQIDSLAERVPDLRATDGTLVLADYISGGVTAVTQAMILQAVTQQAKFVLFVGKINYLFSTGLSEEGVYQSIYKIVDEFNTAVKASALEGSPAADVHPSTGTVAFGSTADGWAFTLPRVATKVAPSLGMSSADLQSKLWGDWYYQADKKQWSQECKSGDKNKERGFNRFVLGPLLRLYTKASPTIASELGVELTKEEQQTTGTQLIRATMRKHSPLSRGVLDVLSKLPDTVTAQQYRASTLLESSGNSTVKKAAQNCDSGGKAPLLISVTKSVVLDGDKTALLGRVFSGRITSGAKVHVRGWTYGPDSKQVSQQATIGCVCYALGCSALDCPTIPAGNLVYLLDIGTCPFLQSGTISTLADAPPFQSSILTSVPVMDCHISPSSAGSPSQLKGALETVKKHHPEITFTEPNTKNEITVSGPREKYFTNALQHLIEILGQQSLTLGSTTIRSRKSPDDPDRQHVPYYLAEVIASSDRQPGIFGLFTPQRGRLQESESISASFDVSRWSVPVDTSEAVLSQLKSWQGVAWRLEFEEYERM